ncbi:MAG: methyltransferase [Acidobacteria bacterium]|nr:methyltransferase [Acidobacteriota bacterium]
MTCELPLKLGTPQAFARIQSFLRDAGYTEANLCRLLGIERICDFEQVDLNRLSRDTGESPLLSLLTRVFFLLREAPGSEIVSHIPADVLGSMQALDLLVSGDEKSTFESRVWLYPMEGLLLASDRNKNLPDAVFPAISPLSYRFLKRMGRSPAARALDLCSGSGVAALTLSQHCERVVASDVSVRAIHFARFNCQLNDRSNVAVLESDFYASLGGESFDRIVAHPPYVPSLSNAVVWRDGGATGEEPIRRIVEGLPQYLRSGGAFYAACGGFDTKENTFEQRVRSWLGSANGEFDVLFAVEFDKSPWQLAVNRSPNPAPDFPENRQLLLERFSEIGALNFVAGALVIERKLGTQPHRQPLTLRTQLSPLTDGACFDSFLGWWRWVCRPEAPQELAQLKPRLGSTLRVNITHVVNEQELLPIAFVVESLRPFHAETKVDPEIVQVLLRCDGKTSLVELFEMARAASLVPERFTLVDFLKFGAKMIERGYLEIDER